MKEKRELIRATHEGPLKIGDIEFRCVVLENGTRVISGRGFMKGMGMYRSGAMSTRRKDDPDGAQIPLFLAYKNLKPFINKELTEVLSTPLEYLPKNGNRVQGGIKAEAIPQICDVWLQARDAGVLRGTQLLIATKCDILIRALAHVGIIALVDEATGYQEDRDREALQAILDKYLRDQVLAKWAKTFPDEFYEQLFKLKGWQYRPLLIKRPGVVGHWTNDIVYARLAPGILAKLREKTPKDHKGRRRHKFFQWLTDDYGHPALKQHLSNVIFLMRAHPTWQGFYRALQRAAPKYGDRFLPHIHGDDE